jgi:outer membrane immunogenic protein
VFKVVFLSFALTIASMAADAADVSEPAKANRITPSAPWTGCFVGGNIGGGRQTTQAWWGDEYELPAGSNIGSSIIGGGQAGCDYQSGAWVVGFQGMFDRAAMSGSNQIPNVYWYDIVSTKADWLATITGKFGYMVEPNTLLYGRGGIAWVRNAYADYAVYADAKNSETITGWTIGGGVEHLVTKNWSLFAEYNYAAFDDQKIYLSDPSVPVSEINLYSHGVQILQVGANFRFN